MKGYILSIAGIVLISSVITVIAPNGKMGQFVKGMTHLFLLIVMISPVLGWAKGEFSVKPSAVYPDDEGYFTACAQLLEARDEENIAVYLNGEFGVSARVDAVRSRTTAFDLEKIRVTVTFQGIIGEEERINILTRIQSTLKDRYGCDVEVT